MSMWDEVLESLRTMSVWQLLFAFLACTGYALAQGGLVGPRARWAALALTALAALGFVLEAERWVDGFMLIVLAIAGLGVFAALVWLVSRLLGMAAVDGATARPADSLLSVPPGDAEGGLGHGQPIAAPRRAAPSH